MRTHLTTRPLTANSLRGARSHRPRARVAPLIAGQCFDIDVSSDVRGWLIRIPEIAAVTHAIRRIEVELSARECIAERTGIPIGYITVRLRD
jgi:hypothetical protein